MRSISRSTCWRDISSGCRCWRGDPGRVRLRQRCGSSLARWALLLADLQGDSLWHGDGLRSEVRRVGKECVSTFSSLSLPSHLIHTSYLFFLFYFFFFIFF